MKDYISILCPTRGRPDRFREMAKSAYRKGDGRFEILAWVDEDDPTRSAYSVDEFQSASLFVGPAGKRISYGWNRMAKYAIGDWFMMGNDDLIFATPHWDTILLKHLNAAWSDRMFVAWVDDMTGKAPKRCCFPVVSRQWRKALGYFVPECFNFLWHDTWVWDVGRRCNRLLYLPDIQIEHRHFTRGKAKRDRTYARHRDGEQQRQNRIDDRLTYEREAATRQQHADKLLAQFIRKEA